MTPGRRAVRAFAAWLAALWVLAVAPITHAQSGLELRSSISQTTVEVGQPFSVKLRALAGQGEPVPTAPQLSPPSGFTVQGPSVSTQTFASFGSGGSSVKQGIGATWELVASAPGSYVIPAPSVSWNGVRRSAQPLTVEVVQQGAGPSSGGSSPFLFPGPPGFPSSPSFPSSPGWPFGQLEESDEPDESQMDKSDALKMSEPLEKNVFLRAIVDKSEAVIGEQITISFYVYYQVDFEMAEPRQAPLSDFIRVPLLNDPDTSPAKMTRVGGEMWGVRLVERMAIFPVRAGDLETGSMSARFVGRRIGSRVLRESNNETIRVTEPPADGRPVGYGMGDVGNFSLEANVQPRQTDQNGAVGVTLKVKGTGNLPTSIRVPARTGIDWLAPSKREEIEATDGVVGGWRTFEYVVRIKESGTVDLGTVELPFYDAKTKRYEVATATLGAIEVKPVHPSDDEIEKAKEEGKGEDPFAAMPGPRSTLNAFVPRSPPVLDGWTFWLAVAAAPLAVGVAWTARGAAGAVSRRRRDNLAGWSRQVKTALSDASAAQKAGDDKALASAVERAVHAAIEGVTGLKSRGVMLRDLSAELHARDVEGDLAGELEAVLASSDALRFDPSSATGGAEGLYKKARAVIAKLERRPAAG